MLLQVSTFRELMRKKIINFNLVNQCVFLCFSSVLPFLGDVVNLADNSETSDDSAVFGLRLVVPDNSSSVPFTVVAITTYNTSSGVVVLVDELDYVIVRPDIVVTAMAISER